MVGVQEPSEKLAGEMMQDADSASPCDGDFVQDTGIDKNIPQNVTEMTGLHIQEGLNKDSSAAATENPALDNQISTEIETHSLEAVNNQEALLHCVGHMDHSIHQQAGDDQADSTSQLVAAITEDDAEKTVDPGADKDGYLAAIAEEEFSEEVSIQEDDLLTTIIEVLEARHLIETRPLPVLVKGKEVDLLKLCVQVRAFGGYDKVTLWSTISKSLGFGPELGPLLKLVYVKYLKGLENRRLVASQGVEGLQNALKAENEDNPVVKSLSVNAESKSCGNMSAKKRISGEGLGNENSVIDNNLVTPADGSESLAGVLEWVKRLALNPGDPKKGQGARVSRWNEAWACKCEILAGKVRTVLWRRGGHPLHDLSPPKSQDQGHDRKRRGRGSSIKSVAVKKPRRLSS